MKKIVYSLSVVIIVYVAIYGLIYKVEDVNNTDYYDGYWNGKEARIHYCPKYRMKFDLYDRTTIPYRREKPWFATLYSPLNFFWVRILYHGK